MPVYVYKNRDTGETFEIARSIHDDSPVTDPKTGSENVEKIIQPVSISFKCGGFYVTDNPSARKPL